ncbi:MAG TPA: DUF502 domain-containing protein [Candidatus Eisenbacteria bacterium]
MNGSDMHHSHQGTRETIGSLFARGFYILMPLLLILLIGKKLIEMLQGMFSPVLDRLPGEIIRSATVRFLLLCLLVAAILVLVGFIARRRVGRAIGAWLERRILNKLPFYTHLRGLTTTLASTDHDHSLRTARIEVDIPGLEQLGVIMEYHEDGSATVFLPSAPNPSSGTVVIVARERIRELTIPVRSVVGCMGRYGHGTAAVLKGADYDPMTSGPRK